MMLEIGTVYMRCRTTHHRCTEAFPRKYLSPRTLFIKSEGHLFQIKQVVIFILIYLLQQLKLGPLGQDSLHINHLYFLL